MATSDDSKTPDLSGFTGVIPFDTSARNTKPKDVVFLVEELFDALLPNADFVRLLEAVTNVGSAEGHIRYDDAAAATMIRNLAAERGVTTVSKLTIKQIVHYVGCVMRRRQQGRGQRLKAFLLLNAPKAAE